MLNPEQEKYQEIADSLNQLLYEQVCAATPVETLSNKNDKIVEVVETAAGERFVRRSYTQKAVNQTEFKYGLDFESAWNEMHVAFAEAGLEIVPSRLFKSDGEYSFVVMSEYLEDATPLAEAPTDNKVAVVTGLSSLMAGKNKYAPSPEMVMDDMFMVAERDGLSKALLVDVDPLVLHTNRLTMNDTVGGYYISKLARLAWDSWGRNDEEREEIASAIAITLGNFAMDRFDMLSVITREYFNIHSMANGIDIRDSWSTGQRELIESGSF
jgi:hypothetical protein